MATCKIKTWNPKSRFKTPRYIYYLTLYWRHILLVVQVCRTYTRGVCQLLEFFSLFMQCNARELIDQAVFCCCMHSFITKIVEKACLMHWTRFYIRSTAQIILYIQVHVCGWSHARIYGLCLRVYTIPSSEGLERCNIWLLQNCSALHFVRRPSTWI